MIQFLEDNTDELIAKLYESKSLRIIVTTHHKPDGDAMGSSLALCEWLKLLGHKVVVITPTDYPRFLHWMPGHSEVIIYESNEKKAKTITKEADYIFCLDFNDLKRINEYGHSVSSSPAIKVMIDHHREPSNFDRYRYWTYEASSTSELIYHFIKKCRGTDNITPEIANCLYTGIMTDTGSFRYRGTSADTHRTIAELIDKGAQNSYIHEQVYDSNTMMRLKMMGFVLYEKLGILPAYNTALVYLTREELTRFDIKTGDTEGFVNYGLSIEGIKLSVLIVDRTKLVKMSFRSKGDFPCNEFARDHFEGGGHKNAAGGQSTNSLETTITRFTEVLSLYKEQLQ